MSLVHTCVKFRAHSTQSFPPTPHGWTLLTDLEVNIICEDQ